MVEFLRGKDLSKRIREVVKGTNVRCAVAFWGDNAVKELFGTEKLEREDVEIVCDVSMGGSNPDTLRALGAPSSENLGHIRGLHAKVFHSEIGMVIGSANASNNGIGFLRQGAELIEAGVFVEADSITWKAAKKWFEDEVWFNAEEIDETTLLGAQTRWDQRRSESMKAANHPSDRSPARGFLEYDPDVHGLVYTLWWRDPQEEIEYSDEAETEIDIGNMEVIAHMSPSDDDLREKWVSSFRIGRNGCVDERIRPRFFFPNMLIERGVENGDPGYENLLGESPYGIRCNPPFKFNDPDLVKAFRNVINDPEAPYASLRGEVDAAEWLARDHVGLMHRFWRDVQIEYRRLQA